MKATEARQFHADATAIAGDLQHRSTIRTALRKYEAARDARQARFRDYEAARSHAAAVKWEALESLDTHLAIFADRFEANGGTVHWARDAAEARDVILRIIRDAGARSIIKSKVMTGEEIHLNEALEAAGLTVVESDLGEYIVQLRGEAPYHFVFPAMHLSRAQVQQLFAQKLNIDRGDEPETLTMIAREALRDRYLSADVGISGANFAIAETGMISITENEGNARLTCAIPPIHIALMGIEKVLPRLADLAVFLPLLATAGAGQLLTGYNTLYAGPRRADEADGPRAMHVVLIDNGRTTLLADPEQRDALRCIRCGACLNVCPVYRNVGGHSYGTTYQGPIGSVITPHLRGIASWKHLSHASSLCGACTEACPVRIDLHHHLLHNRRNAAAYTPRLERLAFRLFGALVTRPTLFKTAVRFARLFQPLHRFVDRTRLDPIRAWTHTRERPTIARQTFRDYWKERQP